MGKNLVRKTYQLSTTWVAPAGVKSVRLIISDVTLPAVAGDGVNVAAISNEGDLFAWGTNANGQLGDGTVTPHSIPAIVIGSHKWLNITAANGYFLGLTRMGDIMGWGINTVGNLGLGDLTPRSSPVLVVGGKKWKMVSTNSSFTANAIDANDDMYSWGAGNSGGLGDGTVADKSSPVLVLGGLKWKDVCSGRLSISGSAGPSCLGLTTAGDLYAWGHNAQGQLGDGTTTMKSSPVLVLGGRTWKAIGCCNGAFFAIDSNDDLYAWGDNRRGQLGDGTIVSKSSPVLVLGGRKWASVKRAAQSETAGAIEKDTYDAYGWGWNIFGAIGDGTIVSKSSPVLVLGSKKWVQLSGGGPVFTVNIEFSHGITRDGDVYAWGNSTQGQLGDGTNVSKSSPVIVVGGRQYRFAQSTMESEIFFPVTPGDSYEISLSSGGILFDGVPIYTNAGRKQVTLEYFA